jgi:hypothetical protein
MDVIVSGDENLNEIDRILELDSRYTNIPDEEFTRMNIGSGQEKINHIKQNIRLIRVSTAKAEGA